MSKMLEVELCNDCGCFRIYNQSYYCVRIWRKFIEDEDYEGLGYQPYTVTIPDWCPLPDYNVVELLKNLIEHPDYSKEKALIEKTKKHLIKESKRMENQIEIFSDVLKKI